LCPRGAAPMKGENQQAHCNQAIPIFHESLSSLWDRACPSCSEKALLIESGLKE
jgi:hypothetical protein